MATQMLKYFAYASNLFKERTFHTVGMESKARVLGPAILKEFDLCFDYYSEEWKGCKATCRAKPGQFIWGLLWEVTDVDRQKLSRAEEVHLGKYREIQVEVTTPDGTVHQCFSYQLGGTIDPNGLPSPQYKDIIVRGARQANLPQQYMDILTQKPDNRYTGNLKIYEEILKSITVD